MTGTDILIQEIKAYVARGNDVTGILHESLDGFLSDGGNMRQLIVPTLGEYGTALGKAGFYVLSLYLPWIDKTTAFVFKEEPTMALITAEGREDITRGSYSEEDIERERKRVEAANERTAAAKKEKDRLEQELTAAKDEITVLKRQASDIDNLTPAKKDRNASGTDGRVLIRRTTTVEEWIDSPCVEETTSPAKTKGGSEPDEEEEDDYAFPWQASLKKSDEESSDDAKGENDGADMKAARHWLTNFNGPCINLTQLVDCLEKDTGVRITTDEMGALLREFGMPALNKN